MFYWAPGTKRPSYRTFSGVWATRFVILKEDNPTFLFQVSEDALRSVFYKTKEIGCKEPLLLAYA